MNLQDIMNANQIEFNEAQIRINKTVKKLYDKLDERLKDLENEER